MSSERERIINLVSALGRATGSFGVNAVDRQAAVFYFHPWEIDVDQPRVEGIGAKTRFRHYINLDRMESRLQRLLDDFRWGRMDAIFLDRSLPARSRAH